MPLKLIFTDGTLVGAGGNAISGRISVAAYDELRISSTSTGGTYVLELDWGRTGTSDDYTETVTVTNNAYVTKKVALPYVNVRVRNTGAGAFTAHRTSVSAWVNPR